MDTYARNMQLIREHDFNGNPPDDDLGDDLDEFLAEEYRRERNEFFVYLFEQLEIERRAMIGTINFEAAGQRLELEYQTFPGGSFLLLDGTDLKNGRRLSETMLLCYTMLFRGRIQARIQQKEAQK